MDCLVTKLKAVVDNDNLPFFEPKGMVIFDNTAAGAETDPRGFVIRLNGTKDKLEAMDENIMTQDSAGKMTVDTSVTAKARWKYNFSDVNYIDTTIAGGGYQTIKSNFKLRMIDLVKCTNAEHLDFIGLSLSDEDYDIEKLGAIPNLKYLYVQGGFQDKWYGGDLVRLADNFVANGRNLSTQSVFIFRAVTSGYCGKYTLDGAFYQMKKYYTHIVFNSTGYKVYNLESSTALQDYSQETAIYTKTF